MASTTIKQDNSGHKISAIVECPAGPEDKIATMVNGKEFKFDDLSTLQEVSEQLKKLRQEQHPLSQADKTALFQLQYAIQKHGPVDMIRASSEIGRTFGPVEIRISPETGTKTLDRQPFIVHGNSGNPVGFERPEMQQFMEERGIQLKPVKPKHGDPFKDGTEPGNIKPSSHQLADGTIVLEPGNTPDALTAEAALHSGKPMPGEKPLSEKWWKKINQEEGPSNFMSQNDAMDHSGRFKNFGEFLQALFKKFFPTNEEGARMASNAPFKNLKLEDGTPLVVPKDIEPLDPKTGKTPELEPAVNPLAPGPMQQMAMGMNNPTPGMKFA